MTVEIGLRLGLLAVAIVAVLLLAIFALGGEATRAVWQENGAIENVSALSYYFFLRTPHPARWYLALWCVFCIVFFGEETSWLQHQLDFQTPEAVASRNAQREFNLHNLTVLQGGQLLGNESLSWKTLLKSQHLFQLAFLAYFLLLPAAALVQPTRRWLRFLQTPYPGPLLVLCIWIPIALSIGLTALADLQTKAAIAESREMIYALSIFAFVGCYAWQTSRPASKTAAR
jgi:hypothetical protein